MTRGILMEWLLPSALVGTLFYVLMCFVKPLLCKVGPRWRFAAGVAGMLVFALPLQKVAGALLALRRQPVTMEFVLRSAAPAAPAVQAGKTFAKALVHAAAQPQPVQGGGARFDAGFFLQMCALVWLLGAAVSLMMAVARYVVLDGKFAKVVNPVAQNDRRMEIYMEVCTQMRVGRAPALCAGEVRTPLLVGVLRPKIVLPNMPVDETQLRFALCHELAHCKRGDLWLKLLLRILTALHWFNPAVYFLGRDVCQTCEECCDLEVARVFGDGSRKAYAALLLDFAAPKPSGGVWALSTSAAKLKRRLESLMKPKKSNKWLTISVMGLVVVLLAATLLAGCGFATGVAAVNMPYAGQVELPQTSSTVVSLPEPAQSVSVPEDEESAPESVPEGSGGDNETPDSSQISKAEPVAKAVLGAGGMICPVPDATYLSRLKKEDGHRGVDFNAEESVAVYAAQAGTVTEAGVHDSYGNYLVIDHGNGLKTLYAHNATLSVAKEQQVESGEQVAMMGESGLSTGIHCHFEVLQDDVPMNPLDYIALTQAQQKSVEKLA